MKFYFKPILLSADGSGHSSGPGGDDGWDDPFAENSGGTRRVLQEVFTENADVQTFGLEPVPEVVPDVVSDVVPEVSASDILPVEGIELDTIG